MFVSVLLPYIDRGYGPLFHWVMLRQLAAFGPGQVSFIADERYFCRPAPWGEEMDMLGFTFRCPSEAAFRSVRKATVPWAVFDELDRRSQSMLDAYRTLLTEVYSPLREMLVSILGEWRRQGPIEAILSWCNLPSLSRAAAEYDLPVIHNELGPLRPPHYQPTVYFDFQGVNGKTSAREGMARFAREARRQFSPLSLPQLRALFARQAEAEVAALAPAAAPAFPIGLALQVEDDSNLLAYTGGRTNFDLIYAARKRHGQRQVLIRAHPHGHMTYAAKLGVPDDSPDSGAFLARCQEVWTLNSSVAFECLLREKPVRVLGDSAAALLDADSCGAIDPETRLWWLNYLFLAYLVPARFLFDAEYYRWRLTHPPLEEICRKHLRLLEEESGVVVSQADAQAAPGSGSPAPALAAAPWIAPVRFSFLEQFQTAKLVQGQAAQTAAWEVVLDGESSAAVLLQPPAQLVFEIPTGASGTFSTAVALHPDVWDKPSAGGCEFHLRIDGRLAFVLAIDPVHLLADRRWHPLCVSVPGNREGRHQVLLETRAAATDFRWALWRDPSFLWEAPVGNGTEAVVLGARPGPVEAKETAVVEGRNKE